MKQVKLIVAHVFSRSAWLVALSRIVIQLYPSSSSSTSSSINTARTSRLSIPYVVESIECCVAIRCYLDRLSRFSFKHESWPPNFWEWEAVLWLYWLTYISGVRRLQYVHPPVRSTASRGVVNNYRLSDSVAQPTDLWNDRSPFLNG